MVLKQVDFSSLGKQKALKDNSWSVRQTKFQTGEKKLRISFHSTVYYWQILPFTAYYSEVLLTENQDDPFNKKQHRKQVRRTFHI